MGEVQRLVRKAAKNVYRVVEDPEFWTPQFCAAFFEWCGEQAYERPDTVLMRGQIALDLASKTRDRHVRAKAHTVMALAYRRMSLLDLGKQELERARVLARKCPCCLAEILRGEGIIQLYQLDFATAIACFDRAIANHQMLGNEDGIGRCLIARGVAHWRLGDTDSGLKDEETALALLAPETPQFFYISALTNTAHFLATSSEPRHYELAESFLNTLRDKLAGMTGITAVRIALSWTHGLILAHLGERKRALQMLRKARLRLLQRRQDAEVIAITADIGRLYCETTMYRYLADLIRDSLARLGDVNGTRDLLKETLHAAERELTEAKEYLAQLRAAVTVAVPSPFDASPTLRAISAP